MGKEGHRVWHAFREHAVHWMVGGVLLSLTGFVPEEWVAHTVHGLHIPDSVLHLWSAGVDVRVVPIAIGVAVVAVAVIWQRHAVVHAAVPDAITAAAPPEDTAMMPKRVARLPVQDASDGLPLPDKPSIAVLPFTNISGDPEQEYFSDGMAEDIITALSRSRALFVIARNSSFTYKARAVDVKQVARELGVRYVLEGSVRRGGDRVRVSEQLIDAETGNHLWAERYDRELADTFAVQDEITTAVTLAIGPAISDAEQQRASRKQPESLGAWDAYTRGLWHLARVEQTRMPRRAPCSSVPSNWIPIFHQPIKAWSMVISIRCAYSARSTPLKHRLLSSRSHTRPLRSTRAMQTLMRRWGGCWRWKAITRPLWIAPNRHLH